MRPHLTDASGGLNYHWRAWRGRARWAPFVATVADWLADWRPTATELVIVGPSAGYSLNAPFLGRFARVWALEPDPLARWLLARRFPAVPFDFPCLDCLGAVDGPARLASRFPGAAVLFANVLGQTRNAEAVPAFAAALRQALAGHAWASYHDLLSAPAAPARPIPHTLPEGGDVATLARELWAGRPLTVTDHGTAGLLPGPAHLALWALAPGAWHVVAWQVNPGPSGEPGHPG